MPISLLSRVLNGKRTMLRQLVICFLACAVSLPLLAAAPADEILVAYRDGQHFASRPGQHLGHGVHLLSVQQQRGQQPADQRATQARRLAALRSDPAVAYAEPNYHGYFDNAPTLAATPDDPGYSGQWWLEAVGARQSWAIATGRGVTVAVIDSGVDLTHPDLRANLRSDGYNFGDGNATPQDVLGHGTVVAGIVAAQRANSLAGSGLAPDARVLPIKVSSSQNEADFTAAAVQQAIDYAIGKGVQVINLSLSFSPGEEPQTVKDALERAFAAGIVVVAASGNNGPAVYFPGTYPGVITVAGTKADGSIADFSNLGPEVALAAPGAGILSTMLGGGIGLFNNRGNGTSFAAPAVSAALALLLQADPRLSRPQLLDLLQQNGKPLTNSTRNFKILDSGQSLLALLPDLSTTQNAFAKSDSLRLAYRLPATAAASDLYVALQTPVGEYCLHGDGSWSAVADTGYAPLLSGMHNRQATSGSLYGADGVLPALPLAGLPAGNYIWRIALFDPLQQRLIGTVMTAPLSLQ